MKLHVNTEFKSYILHDLANEYKIKDFAQYCTIEYLKFVYNIAYEY